MIYSSKIKNVGYEFIPINLNTKKIINNINKIINNYLKSNQINILKLDKDNFYKTNLKLQKLINRKIKPEKIFKNNSNHFLNVFNDNKIATQHYFYLRMVRPDKGYQKTSPIDLHRETFQGPKFYKNIFNLWLPIKGCSKNNAIRFIKKSHLFKKNKDFTFKLRSTGIIKGSAAHKTGLLYKDRVIKFKKKYKPQRLFKKNNLIFFTGELIHGNGINNTNQLRISIDLRFMLSKNMKYNPLQGATKKKYFKQIKI